MNIDYTTLILDVTEFDCHYTFSGRNSRFGHPMQAYSRQGYMMHVLCTPNDHEVGPVVDYAGPFSEDNLKNLLTDWGKQYDLKGCTIDFGLMVMPSDPNKTHGEYIKEKCAVNHNVSQYRIVYKSQEDKWAFSRSTCIHEFPLAVCYEDIGMAKPPARVPRAELSFLATICSDLHNLVKLNTDANKVLVDENVKPKLTLTLVFDDGIKPIKIEKDVNGEDVTTIINKVQSLRSKFIERCNDVAASRLAGESTSYTGVLTFTSSLSSSPVRTVKFHVTQLGETIKFADTNPINRNFLDDWLGIKTMKLKKDEISIIAFIIKDRYYSGVANITGEPTLEIRAFEEITKDEFDKLVSNM